MKYLILFLFTLNAYAGDSARIIALANNNGFEVDESIVNAIVEASHTFGIKVEELTAIGILETGLGKYNATKVNLNGTIDQGIFQINTVNLSKCAGFDVQTVQGSAYCAAKLLRDIKKHHSKDYLGRYHSKTPSQKAKYQNALSRVLKPKG